MFLFHFEQQKIIIVKLILYFIAKSITNEIMITLYITSISFPFQYVVNGKLEIYYEGD